MPTRYCPYCFIETKGGGQVYQRGRCHFCNNKRRVNSEYVKWNDKKEKTKKIKYDKIKIECENLLHEKTRDYMEKWEEKNPAPKKFPK